MSISVLQVGTKDSHPKEIVHGMSYLCSDTYVVGYDSSNGTLEIWIGCSTPERATHLENGTSKPGGETRCHGCSAASEVKVASVIHHGISHVVDVVPK